MKRNAYLINNYLKSYMLATILTIAVLQINGIVDSLIMGNFIGPEALAAINVSAPALSVIGGFSSLLAGGAVILAGKALGARDYKLTNQIATTVLLSILAAGILISILSFFVVDYIANLMCIGNSLFPLVKGYISVILFGSVFIMLNTALDNLTEVGGNPKVVTQTAILNCIVNLVMDIVLVAGLGLGIEGAAIATLMGAAVSIYWMWRVMCSDKSPYNLTLKELQFVTRLKENIREGIPMLFNSLAGIALMLLMNYFVQKMQGEAGMFAMSIILVSMGLGLMLAGGSGAAFVAIGSMLYGRGDYVGMRMLYKRCVVISVSSSVIAVFVSQFASGTIANVFGAHDSQYVEMVEKALPVASWFVLALCLLSILAVVYQVLGHIKLCTPAIISLPIFTGIGLGYIYIMEYYDYLWAVFPFAGFGAVIITLILSEIVRRKSNKKLSVICLLPLENSKGTHMNSSMICDQNGITENLIELRKFCESINLDEKKTDIVLHCVEELLINIVEHSGLNKKNYVDMGITIDDEKITAYIQDNGKPFDPTKSDVEKESIGLKLLKHYCSDITYQYSFGQNATFMKWPLN